MSDMRAKEPDEARGVGLTSTIDLVPERLLHGKARGDLKRLAAVLDKSVRREAQGGAFKVHEPTLRSFMTSDRDLFSADFEERTIRAIRPSGVLISDDRGTDRVSWSEYVREAHNIDVPGNRGLDASAFSSNDQLERALRELYPQLPPDAFDPTKMKQAIDRVLTDRQGSDQPDRSSQAVIAPAGFWTWWDCVVRKYGEFWWGIGFFALMCFVVTWPNIKLGAFFAGLWLGATALFVALMCLINPSW